MNWFLACMVWLFIYFYGNVTLTHFNHQCIIIFMRMCVRDVLVLRVELLWLAGAVLLPSALLCAGFRFSHISRFLCCSLVRGRGSGLQRCRWWCLQYLLWIPRYSTAHVERDTVLDTRDTDCTRPQPHGSWLSGGLAPGHQPPTGALNTQ